MVEHKVGGVDPQYACDRWAETFKDVCGFAVEACDVLREDFPMLKNYGWLRMKFTTCTFLVSRDTIKTQYEKFWRPMINEGYIEEHRIHCM
jgi:hypothetical protein